MSDPSDFYLPRLSYLVVEDEAISQSALSKLLYGLNATSVETANDGSEALRILIEAEEPPDIICLDINMPVMGGPEFIRALSSLSYPGTVILISGLDPETVEVAMQMALMRDVKVAGVVEKPATASKITNVLAASGYAD